MTEENEDQVILLKDEHGEEHEFHVIDFLTEDEKKYVVLQPALDNEDLEEKSEAKEDDQEAEYEAVIMRIEEQDDDHILVLVEDDDEWERIAKAFEEKQHS